MVVGSEDKRLIPQGFASDVAVVVGLDIHFLLYLRLFGQKPLKAVKGIGTGFLWAKG